MKEAITFLERDQFILSETEKEDQILLDIMLKAIYLVVDRTPFSMSKREVRIFFRVRSALRAIESQSIDLTWHLLISKLTHVIPIRCLIMENNEEMKALTTK